MKGRRYLWLFVVVFLLLAYPMWLLAGGPIGLGRRGGRRRRCSGTLLRTWLFKPREDAGRAGFITRSTRRSSTPRPSPPTPQAAAQERLKAERVQVAQRRDDDLQKAKQKQAKAVADGEEQRDERLREINQVYAQKVQEIQAPQARRRRARPPRSTSAGRPRSAPRTRPPRASSTSGIRRSRRRSGPATRRPGHALEARWREGLARVAGGRSTRSAARSTRSAPRWDDPAWADRPLPGPVPPVVRFGEVRVGLDQLPRGVPADARLREGIPTEFPFPALLPFPDRANLLIEAPREGRAAAVGLLQAAMLRLLTSLPPGQVRFTIVDPVGIGRNFGAFMHLADFDEALVTGQVWTEPRQIDERLADLSAHMEKVTQKYLRNEYATLGEYNAVAGEVAEPYRVLVVADFPAGFDEKAAARLAAIAAGGRPVRRPDADRRRPRPPAARPAPRSTTSGPHAASFALGRRAGSSGPTPTSAASRSPSTRPPPPTSPTA